MRKFHFLASVLLMFSVSAAWAFDRPFPPVAKRGTMAISDNRTVSVDGKVYRLSAGNRIWNQNNRLQRPSTLIGMQAIVNYTEDRHGNIDRVWILTDKEATQTPEEQKITSGAVMVR